MEVCSDILMHNKKFCIVVALIVAVDIFLQSVSFFIFIDCLIERGEAAEFPCSSRIWNFVLSGASS